MKKIIEDFEEHKIDLPDSGKIVFKEIKFLANADLYIVVFTSSKSGGEKYLYHIDSHCSNNILYFDEKQITISRDRELYILFAPKDSNYEQIINAVVTYA